MAYAVPRVCLRFLLVVCLAALMGPLAAGPAQATGATRQMTLLVPSRATVEAPVEKAADPARAQGAGEKATQKEASQKEGKQAAKDASRKGAAKKDDGRKAAGQKVSGQKLPRQEAPERTDAMQAEGDTSSTQAAGEPAEGAAPAPQAPPMEEIVAQVSASILASASPVVINEEVVLLVAGMELSEHRGIAMDMPRIFTVYRFDREAQKPDQPVWREDLLGDIEEIRYLDQKAWGACVGLERPGLYQFSIETRPWWNAEERGYEQQLVKTMLPVHGESWGWHRPVGMSFEIVPETRPFGLLAPALITGRVLVDGKPAAGLEVEVERINTDGVSHPSPWHRFQSLRTREDGRFAAVLTMPGWWCCRALREGEPLKGPDGEPSPLRLATLFWFYVDAAPAQRQ